MKQTILDVLRYLFEHYAGDDPTFNLDQERLQLKLREAGFEDNEILRALQWLEELAALQEQGPESDLPKTNAIRIFTVEEMTKLDVESRGFLLFLEQVGVLDHPSRELVIDRLMALESDEIDLRQVKWVVLMVLLNQPGREEALVWMEDVVMDELRSGLH
jgi:Smg protein